MLDLTSRKDIWDESLRPAGYGNPEMEPFETWWERNASRLLNLSADIAEQWIYRHWTSSPFRFLLPYTVNWRRENWSTRAVLRDVHVEFGGPLDPKHDYEVFQGRFGPLQTARSWCNRSWRPPILVLETPGGVRSHDGEMPSVRFVLIEGAKRMRYLNALHFRGEDTGPHALYILSFVLAVP